MREYRCEECRKDKEGKRYVIDYKLVCPECRLELIHRTEAEIERYLIEKGAIK